MSVESWRAAARHLKAATGTPTAKQRALAEVAGVPIRRGVPQLVFGAQLRSALADALHLESGPPVGNGQHAYLSEIAGRAGVTVKQYGSRHEFDAWLRHAYLTLRLRALEQLKLETGDLVRYVGQAEPSFRVSSIGLDGAIFFKGGARAWPDQLEVAFRCGDGSRAAKECARRAEKAAASRAPEIGWSLARHRDLEQFEVPADPSATDVLALQEAVREARDERPIQLLLQERPQLLAALVRGPMRYCVPQVQLGVNYVADFLLAEVNSLGVQWTLVELETPESNVALARSNQLDKYARKGKSQIDEWREWLQDNPDQAKRPRSQHGLGLADIRPNAPGLVLVGRRARLAPRAASVRKRIEEQDRILIHTYDWLIEAVRGALAHDGPPATNPHLLRRYDSLEDFDDEDDEFLF